MGIKKKNLIITIYMENKQTAAEWLIDQLRQLAHNPSTHLGMGDIRVTQGILDDLEEQAKQMEKEQAERMYSEAIEFAEWIRIKDFQTASKDNWIGLNMKCYTTKELFEQFKKK